MTKSKFIALFICSCIFSISIIVIGIGFSGGLSNIDFNTSKLDTVSYIFLIVSIIIVFVPIILLFIYFLLKLIKK